VVEYTTAAFERRCILVRHVRSLRRTLGYASIARLAAECASPLSLRSGISALDH